jgi:hypothetical protein
MYLAYVIPVYLRLTRPERFTPGPWNLGKHYKWINVGAIMFGVVCVIALDLPFTHAAVPWNDGFDATALNYTPLVLVMGIVVAIWWKLGANKRYTGPVRTIDTDELGRIIDVDSGGTPPPAPAAPVA